MSRSSIVTGHKFAKPFSILIVKRKDNKIKLVRKTIETVEDFDNICHKAKSDGYGIVNGLTPERQMLMAMASFCGFLV